jgi:hypothetical protein
VTLTETFVIARSQQVGAKRRPMTGSATKQSIWHLVYLGMECFAEPVIGRAFARPVGLQRRRRSELHIIDWFGTMMSMAGSIIATGFGIRA